MSEIDKDKLREAIEYYTRYPGVREDEMMYPIYIAARAYLDLSTPAAPVGDAGGGELPGDIIAQGLLAAKTPTRNDHDYNVAKAGAMRAMQRLWDRGYIRPTLSANREDELLAVKEIFSTIRAAASDAMEMEGPLDDFAEWLIGFINKHAAAIALARGE